MKCALIAGLALLAMPMSAWAASPQEDYLAARDAYIKQFAHSAQDDATFKAYERALADLQARLGRIIGPVRISGFAGDGKISLDALDQDDEGFGLLDGLVYRSADEKAQVLVTTAGLFDKWLKAHASFWPESPLPPDMGAALKRDDFYTQAINDDAAVVTYAEVPIARPAWATLAFAVLDARTQDAVPPVPDEMIITVRSADRVFILSTKTAVAAGPIAACDALHARLAAQAQAASDADRAADGKDAALHAKAEQLARTADRAYPDCFAKEARHAAFFPALVKQAQELIELLSTK